MQATHEIRELVRAFAAVVPRPLAQQQKPVGVAAGSEFCGQASLLLRVEPLASKLVCLQMDGDSLVVGTAETKVLLEDSIVDRVVVQAQRALEAVARPALYCATQHHLGLWQSLDLQNCLALLTQTKRA